MIDALEVLLDALHVLGELGLSLDQQLRVVAEVKLQLLLDRVQLGQSFAELKSWNTYSFLLEHIQFFYIKTHSIFYGPRIALLPQEGPFKNAPLRDGNKGNRDHRGKISMIWTQSDLNL